MDTSKLTTALGYAPFDPWPVDPAFHPTDRLWHYRRQGEPGSPELLSQILYRNPRRSGGATGLPVLRRTKSRIRHVVRRRNGMSSGGALAPRKGSRNIKPVAW
jgi:hypothetical protein